MKNVGDFVKAGFFWVPIVPIVTFVEMQNTSDAIWSFVVSAQVFMVGLPIFIGLDWLEDRYELRLRVRSLDDRS